MKILVCIKQVPDMESRFEILPDNAWYDEVDLAWRMNEYDAYAVEAAVRLAETVTDADITVLSVGPERVRECLRKALAMGGDRAVHIVDDSSARRDSFEIAALIASFARDNDFDLVFTGMQSQDRGSGQVGPLLAELLQIPFVTTVVDFVCDGEKATVRRELEGGCRAAIRLPLPLLVTCQLGLNHPRYPTLPGIMKAKQKELIEIAASKILDIAPRVTAGPLFLPQKKAGGVLLEGNYDQVADQLIRLIREATTIMPGGIS